MTKINKYTWFVAFQKGFCTFVRMFFDLPPTFTVRSLSRYIYNVKIQFFVTLKSDQDPDSHLFGFLLLDNLENQL